MNEQQQMIMGRAFSLALELHNGQKRKHSIIKGGTDYLSHLMEVAGMVLANGGTPVVCAAALLHDAVEDQGKETIPTIEGLCGTIVLSLVLECTEEGTGDGEKAPWKDRKDSYLRHIPQCSLGATLIKIADKLQSARELKLKCQQIGNRHAVIDRFGGGYQGQHWFHARFIQACQYRLELEQQESPMSIGAGFLLGELIEVCTWLFAEEE